jgi:hypothetical protein
MMPKWRYIRKIAAASAARNTAKLIYTTNNLVYSLNAFIASGISADGVPDAVLRTANGLQPVR